MGVEKISHYGSRAFFIVALALFTTALVELALVLLGVAPPIRYQPGDS